MYGIGEHSRAAVAAFDRGGRHFMDVTDLIAALADDLEPGGEPPVVLVKGSRGMRLERVVAALVEPGEMASNREGHR